MTVDELIEELKLYSATGMGDAKLYLNISDGDDYPLQTLHIYKGLNQIDLLYEPKD